MRCEHCGSSGEEDGVAFYKGRYLCDHCFDEMMEVFREANYGSR